MSDTQPNSDRSKLLLPGLIALAAAAMLVTLAAAGALFGVLPLPASTQVAPSASEPTASASPVTAPTTTATDAATLPPQLPPQVLSQMQQIEQEVITLRGLRPSAEVSRRLVPSSELEQVVRQDLLDDYSQDEARDDALRWALFGWVEPGFDLWSFYLDLYSEQVAGFYDDEQELMYIVQGRSFEGPERLTYAHEFAHALQDQNYDLDEGLQLNESSCEGQSDRCSAVRALVEGDATLVEAQWLRTFATELDREQISAFYESLESPVLRGAPQYVQESFIFPYQAGLEFVAHAFRNRGWAAVDEVYTQPPRSSEQIVEPARYPDDAPVTLLPPQIDPEALGQDWRSLDEGTLGHFNLRLLLAEQLSAEEAQRAADGWGGDWYQAFHNDDSGRSAVVLVQAWDTIRDAQQAYLAWRAYGEARIGPREPTGQAYEFQSDAFFARLERSSYQTLWVMAPDAELADALRAAVSFPVAEE